MKEYMGQNFWTLKAEGQTQDRSKFTLVRITLVSFTSYPDYFYLDFLFHLSCENVNSLSPFSFSLSVGNVRLLFKCGDNVYKVFSTVAGK